ncbi:fatty acyl-AMP ligase [Maritimibacter sp. 55A14]|uniref:fatty acyl-AMP ligase n=1 Tax=Maritimibacter sp. 55A14 TaxID=2174844 RepID=UPI000D61ADE6|nr:fatty acyl-AMP ligase [Maritimibacter sp. 55A14]PWE34030.1 fatty acyl-AMP ligase [Maritimibacter sp. 55A14]
MAGITATESGVALRRGNFSSLTDALDYAATGRSGVNFYAADASLVSTLSYADLRDAARMLAGRLAARFERLSRIGLVADTSDEFLIAFMACQYAGLVPASLTLPAAFGGREAYEWQLSRMAQTADLAAVFAPDALRGLLEKAMAQTGVPVLALSGADLPQDSVPTVPHGADGPAYIQFSSGSTSAPKGIVATQASVSANCLAIIRDGLQVVPGDRAVSWLPLYHDMGMVGFFMAPLYSQLSVDYISPTSFARRPGTWLKLISDNRGTLSYSPSFGYELCTRRYRGEELDLSCWRGAGIGGDMVRAEVLGAFVEVFGRSGFDPAAFVSSYGLAEATLAVSFAPLGKGLRIDRVDSGRMQTSGRAIPEAEMERAGQVRSFVACGRPVTTLDVRILDRDNNELGPRRVGRIMVKGPSVASGYFRAGEPLQPVTDADGWLDTGDLGYWLDGELVITGRSKDLILWNGRNIWPQDIEWVAQQTGGRNMARAAAFDVQDADGGSRIMLLAECWSRDAGTRADLMREIAAATRASCGAPVSVELVGVRSLPMTSSGKLSRAAARARFLAGGFAEVVQADPSRAPALAVPGQTS